MCGCKRTTPDNVAAAVNGRTITYAELDKKFQSTFMSSNERPSDDQMAIQKLEVLRALVDNEIMLQRAEKLGLMATDADVESKFAELKAPYTQEEFQRQLAARKITAEDMKAQIKRDLSVDQTVQSRNHVAYFHFRSGHHRLLQREQEQLQFPGAADPSGADPGDARIRIRNVRNLKNDKAQNDDQARKKIDMLLSAREARARISPMLAQNYSEDPQSGAERRRSGFRSGIRRSRRPIRNSARPFKRPRRAR